MSDQMIMVISSVITLSYIVAEVALALFYFVNDSKERTTIAMFLGRISPTEDMFDYTAGLFLSVVCVGGMIFVISVLALLVPILFLIIAGVIGAAFATRSLVRFGKAVNHIRKSVNQHKHNSNGDVEDKHKVYIPKTDAQWREYNKD